MTELLMAHAKRADEFGVTWSLCDANGNDVAVLADADEPVIEAVEWLKERGLCDLFESPDGATVALFGEMP